MKNLSRKLMLSIVAIALVVIALGTSTFAWFTLSNKASVGQFNAEVTAGEGMELSVDGTTWYSNIPSTVIQAKIASNFTALNLNADKPILTAVTTNDENLGLFKKIKKDQTGFEEATANADYIKIQIYVRAVGIDKVSIDTLEVTGTAADWTSDADTFTGANNTSVTEGLLVSVSAASGARIGIRSANATDSTFVYENAAVTTGTTNAVLGGAGVATPTTTLPTIGQAAYFELKNGFNPNVATPTFTNVPTSVIGSVTSVDPAVEVLTLTDANNGFYAKTFDLFVWFEGFDADTYDSILKMPLNIKMSFIGSIVTP